MTELEIRSLVVNTAKKYLGSKEADGTHKQILDIYNNHKPIARGYKMTTKDPWCATYVSAIAIKCGYTDIMPTECSCTKMIELYKAKNRWEESDAYVPQIGDIIMYDWNDSGKGDNTGSPDHVGIVVSVSGKTIKVIEGNISDSVGYRIMSVDGRYIRGYCLPDYASKATKESVKAPSTPTPTTTTPAIELLAKEVIAGKWGYGSTHRKNKIYEAVQNRVNELLK